MAVLAPPAGRSRQNRRGLLSPLGLAVALLLLAALLLAPHRLGGGAARQGSGGGGGSVKQQSSSSGGSSNAAQQGSGGAPRLPTYQGVPEVGMHMNLPTWALCPQPPCQYSALADGAPNTSVPFDSQFGEDVWLSQHLFYNKVKGFYVEMGAMNGRDLSNTRWLYRAAGWRGMLVEACPGMADDLIRERKDAIALHAAVCGEFRTVHWHSAANVGGIFEFMAEGFKEEFHKGLSVEGLPEVPCVPFQFLLDKFGIDSIDFWSLDVEGAELEVLHTVDFSRLQVKVIMVELDGHNKEKDIAVTKLLLGAGYQVLKKTDAMSPEMKHFNTIFVHASAWPHLAHAPNVTQPEVEPEPLSLPPAR